MQGKIIFSLVCLISLLSSLFAITRDEVYMNGVNWEIIRAWSPQKDTAYFPYYGLYNSYWTVPGPYYVESYVYGGEDLSFIFLSRIDAGCCAGGYGTMAIYEAEYGKPGGILPAKKLAGIDCSAFVSFCWEVPRYNGTGLANISYRLSDMNKLKPGDMLRSLTHVILVLSSPQEGKIMTIESKPPGIILDPERPLSDFINYEPYSIFPQFVNETPPDGVEIYESKPQISCEITGSGEIIPDLMLLDDQSVNFSVEPISNGKRIKFTPSENLKDGNHTVGVHAINRKVERNFEDSYVWSFKVHGECPVVISTDPADGAQDVDIYQKIKIVFNKAMDRAGYQGFGS